jgi:Xaa-Pro dipeptidase
MKPCHSGMALPHIPRAPLTIDPRQRRYFYYLTGCALPDAYFTYDIATDKSTLFIPPIDAKAVIWSGLPLSAHEALSLYDVDSVQTSNHVPSALAQPQSKSTVWAIDNQVSDYISLLEFENKDLTLLKEAIEECRVVKDEYEIALTKKANAISTVAHTAVLRAVKSAKNERELEGLFIEKCIANGAREQAYHGIFASGTAAATLHYVKNYELLEGKLNLLVDAGGEFNCYASDIVSWFLKPGRNIDLRIPSRELPYHAQNPYKIKCHNLTSHLDTNLPHLGQIQP